ncbi:hypothetical protein P879_06764 [Paragonimus westermani]|uniref:Uncharacterized protein n=1 Tax=Paragonimus westermani TaxID=34504 RepID=A0A8T0DMB3_9TREM|nr:hypothetical protein P879_06764 [Paragonimus westermani]
MYNSSQPSMDMMARKQEKIRKEEAVLADCAKLYRRKLREELSMTEHDGIMKALGAVHRRARKSAFGNLRRELYGEPQAVYCKRLQVLVDAEYDEWKNLSTNTLVNEAALNDCVREYVQNLSKFTRQDASSPPLATFRNHITVLTDSCLSGLREKLCGDAQTRDIFVARFREMVAIRSQPFIDRVMSREVEQNRIHSEILSNACADEFTRKSEVST